jgi:hypothetical protein
LLEILAVAPPVPGRPAIERAQDWLFDAVIDQYEQCRAAPPIGERQRLAG